MLKTFFLILFTTLLYAKDINIALAANMSFAIDKLIEEFKKTHPDANIKYTISGSGKLTAQIERGAPYDIFLSANMKYPKALYDANKTKSKPIIYAKGSLILFSVKPRDFKDGFNIVTDATIKKIAVANPKTAPYGVAGIEALKNAKLYDKVKNKLVYGESISQTVGYTMSATDLGIIAKSAIHSPKFKEYKPKQNWIDIDSTLYTPIAQGMVLLTESKDAKEFFEYLQTKDAKKILKEYGYIVD